MSRSCDTDEPADADELLPFMFENGATVDAPAQDLTTYLNDSPVSPGDLPDSRSDAGNCSDDGSRSRCCSGSDDECDTSMTSEDASDDTSPSAVKDAIQSLWMDVVVDDPSASAAHASGLLSCYEKGSGKRPGTANAAGLSRWVDVIVQPPSTQTQAARSALKTIYELRPAASAECCSATELCEDSGADDAAALPWSPRGSIDSAVARCVRRLMPTMPALAALVKPHGRHDGCFVLGTRAMCGELDAKGELRIKSLAALLTFPDFVGKYLAVEQKRLRAMSAMSTVLGLHCSE